MFMPNCNNVAYNKNKITKLVNAFKSMYLLSKLVKNSLSRYE